GNRTTHCDLQARAPLRWLHQRGRDQRPLDRGPMAPSGRLVTPLVPAASLWPVDREPSRGVLPSRLDASGANPQVPGPLANAVSLHEVDPDVPASGRGGEHYV